MYTVVVTQRLADESVICEVSYDRETMAGNSMEPEVESHYLLFPSETMAATFAAQAENVEPEDFEELCHHLGGEFLW